jgi:hypothetical protein
MGRSIAWTPLAILMATGPVQVQRHRRATRVRVEIPVRVTAMPPAPTFSEDAHTILVNPLGCGVKLSQAVALQTQVRLDGLPGGLSVNARVANCLPLGTGGKAFLVGLALEDPGNVWGLQSPPEDWGAAATPAAPEEDPVKKKNWPYSLFSSKGEAHPGRR